jgi:hypothetical protein
MVGKIKIKKTALQCPLGSFFSTQDRTPAWAIVERHFKFLSSNRFLVLNNKKGRKESIKQAVMKIAQRP